MKLKIKKKKKIKLKLKGSRSKVPPPTRGFKVLEYNDDIVRLCYYSTGAPVMTGHFVVSRSSAVKQMSELIDRLSKDRDQILAEMETI